MAGLYVCFHTESGGYFSFGSQFILSAMAITRGIEPRFPDRQSGIITVISRNHMATPMGFEPTTSCVTGKRSSLLNYGAI